MKMKVIWFCPRKRISGSYLKQNNSDIVFQTRTIFLKWVPRWSRDQNFIFKIMNYFFLNPSFPLKLQGGCWQNDGRHIGGQEYALQHGGQNYFFFIFCYAQICCKRYHIIFSTSSLKFKWKACVQREVIHNFKNNILVTWPARNLLILRKWCGFEKLNHYYFVYDMTH